MKKRFVRCISVCLAVLMICSSALTAFAEDKKETVYVLADAEGRPDNITVSERLYNPDKLDRLEDVSILEDIECTNDDLSYAVEDGRIIWDAGGKDVHYEGTTDAPLPVSVHLSYKLDGKPIDPADLRGKSGRLEIKIDYKALRTEEVTVNGGTETMPVPFLMATVMRVDEEVFDNIEVTHGRVVDAGNFRAVVCLGMPGAYEALHLDEYDDIDIEIPDSATITADVKDFTFYGTYTIATSYVLEGINDETGIDIDLGGMADDLDDAITLLLDGAVQLTDGSEALEEGAATLSDISCTTAPATSTTARRSLPTACRT